MAITILSRSNSPGGDRAGRAGAASTLEAMQLRNARLCLDCEELHEAQQCPVCASESFVYLTRWIPVEDRRSGRRRVLAAPQKSQATRWAQRGAVGLVAFALSRWLWQSSRPSPQTEEGDAPEE